MTRIVVNWDYRPDGAGWGALSALGHSAVSGTFKVVNRLGTLYNVSNDMSAPAIRLHAPWCVNAAGTAVNVG